MENKLWGLQLFGERDGDGAGVEPGNGSGEPASSVEPANGNTEPVSFDDFLAEEGNQAEFDRRVHKAVTTALKNAESKWQAIADDRLSEAERLARMTKEQKAEFKAQKLEEELNQLKREKASAEMASEARRILADEGVTVPDEIVANLIADDADKTKDAVEQFSKAYKVAVQDAVKEALKGTPPKSGTGTTTITKEQIFAIKDPAERQRMIAENFNLFQ